AAVFAASEVPADPTPVDSAPESPVETESLLTADLKKQIVPEAEVPDLIDYSVAVAEKYVCRAYWEETDLNEVVFLKSDGTLARYYFAIPVKYEENGEVFDKKPALVERETLLNNLYRYELTAQNDTAFYCPDNLTHGFLYQGGDMEVALRPITQSEYDFLRGHANAGDLVLPGNILPEGYDSQAVTGTAQSALSVTDEATTAARYVLSTEGEQVNSVVAGQDILSAVPSYNGFQLQLDLAEGTLTQTVYFELDSELLPIPTEGGLLLCDRKGNPVGILGDLLSESGVQNDIPWTVTESLSGTHLLSATLPRNGQTYTLSTTNLFDYLLDASIYDSDQTNYGQSANLWIGYHSTVQQERVLIRPNNWYFTESAAPNQVVQTATITLRDITATEHEAGIEVRPFFGEVWQENTVTWEAVDGNDYGAILDTKAVSAAIGGTYGYYYSFNVTPLVQNWYTGVSNWQKGMIFRWNVDTMCYPMEKCFASSQYSNENYRPRLEVTTAALSTIESGVYELESYAAGAGYYLSAEPVAVDNYATTGAAETQPLSLDTKQTDSLHQKWRVTHIQNNYYTIRPYHYTPAGLYTSGSAAVTAALGTSDLWEEVSSGFLWYIEATPLPGGGYGNCFSLYPYGSGFSLGVYNSSSSWGVYSGDGYGGTDHKWKFMEVPVGSSVRFYDDDGVRESYPVRTMCAGESKWFYGLGLHVSMCVPSGESISPSDYTWISENSSVVRISESTGAFECTGVGLTSIKMTEFGSFKFHIQSFCGEEYYITNLDSEQFINTDNDTAILTQLQANMQKWTISEVLDEGEEDDDATFYTISFVKDGIRHYLSLQSDSVCSSGDGVVLKTTSSDPSDGMLWTLYFDAAITTNEMVRYNGINLSPKLDPSLVLSPVLVPENQGQYVLRLQDWDSTSQKKWHFVKYIHTVNYYADEIIQGNETDAEKAIDSISVLKTVRQRLASMFGVYLVQNWYEYSSVCDLRHNGDCPGDCATIDDFVAQSYPSSIQERSPVQTSVFLNGHDVTWRSVSDKSQYCIIVNPYQRITEYSQANLVSTLIHELNHQFAAQDHYCDLTAEDNQGQTAEFCNNDCDICIHGRTTPRECVMSDSLMTRVCPSCVTIIQNHLNSHHKIEEALLQ
ncbi:MAG: RICIN domain-containing protein, partial [Clostridia bacterium]|nr:RICIN domain-containing protein [Clostridia bacterium]